MRKLLKQVTTTPVAPTQLRREDLKGPRRKDANMATSPKTGKTTIRTKKCWCPECGTEYEGSLGKACADQTCSKCDVPLVGYYCAPSKKEASDMPNEFVLLKLEDLETIEAGDGVRQVIVKDGAEGPVFELEGAEDARDVAKAISAAFGEQAEGDIAKKCLEAEGLEKENEDWSPGKLVETVGSLREALEKMEKQVEEMRSAPMPRPQLPTIGSLAEPRTQEIAKADNAEQFAEQEQAVLNKVAGKEDANLADAMAKVAEWQVAGELESDVTKRSLRDKIVDISLRQK